jgi:hypothetical protein
MNPGRLFLPASEGSGPFSIQVEPFHNLQWRRSAVFGEIGAQRSPISCLPAAIEMAAVAAGDTGMIEYKARATPLLLEREGNERVGALWPVLRSPCLHDAFF